MTSRTPCRYGVRGRNHGTSERTLLLSNTELFALSPSSAAPHSGSTALIASAGTCTIRRSSTPAAEAISAAIWFHVGASSLVIVNASPIASARSSSPVKPTAKSRLCVSVHSELPSPVMTIGLPARMRATAVQPPVSGSFVSS